MRQENNLEKLKADIAKKEAMLKEKEKQKRKEEKARLKELEKRKKELEEKKVIIRKFIENEHKEHKKAKKAHGKLDPATKEALDLALAAEGIETDYSEEYKAVVKEINVLKQGSWTDLGYVWRRLRSKFSKGTSLFINMEMRNGMNRHFVVYLNQPYFKHDGALYIIDDELKYWVSSLGMFALDYHQDLSVPIRRKINLNEIRHTVQSIDSFEVETALNPHSLKQWLESDVVQKIIKGQELDEFMRRLMTIVIIAALSSVAMLLLFMYKSGMFEQISGQLPF